MLSLFGEYIKYMINKYSHMEFPFNGRLLCLKSKNVCIKATVCISQNIWLAKILPILKLSRKLRLFPTNISNVMYVLKF